MNLKRFLFKSAILSLLAFVFVGCSDDDEKGPDYWVPPLSTTQGAYVLNNGNWGDNDASISYYDKESGEVSAANVFESVNNGKNLGDLGQSMFVSGENIYIAVSGSAVIYITDLTCKIKKEIISKRAGQPQEPRFFTAYGDYVYVTFYDGYLARINKKTLELDTKQVEVGPNPEGLKIANGKIYVACSGGMLYPIYNDRVAVVDLKSFTKKAEIEVVINPSKVEVDKLGNIYVISNGNYGMATPSISSSLQVIDTKIDEVVADLGNASYMRISPQGDMLYYINAAYGSAPTYKKYDVKQEEVLAGSFVNEDVTFVGAPSSLDIDPQTGDIYIGAYPPYPASAIGEMTIISSSTGKLIKRFSTGGFYPWGVCFVK